MILDGHLGQKHCTMIVGLALKIIVLHLHSYRKVAALCQ